MALTAMALTACSDDDATGNDAAVNNNNNNESIACGNGLVEGAEECDNGAANSDTLPDTCRTDCTSPRCGDGVGDSAEECDNGVANSDILPDACRTDCTSPRCGDGITDQDHGERCDCGTDPTDLPSGCTMVNSDEDGTTCLVDCHVPGCGDGIIVDPEDCEGGYLGGAGCTDVGFYAGTLACDTLTCTFDTGACVGRCGDDVLNGPEDCDASDLNGETCGDLGYYGGQLFCQTDCAFDLTDCAAVGQCGDAVVQASNEDCDATDFGGGTCLSLGYHGGQLACQTDCIFELTDCASYGFCGDQIIQAAEEQCDASAVTGQDCYGMGYDGGTLGCTSGCQFDTTDCCGDGVVGPSEACDDGNAEDWDGCTGCQRTEFQVNTTFAGRQWGPVVAVADNGRSVIAWIDEAADGNSFGVFAQCYDATGLPAGGEFQVNTATAGRQAAPDVAMAPDGRFVIVWGDMTTGYVNAQRYDVNCQPAGGDLRIDSSGSADAPRVSMADDGRFVVVYALPAVVGRMFDALGQPTSNEFPIFNSNLSYDVGMTADGSFVAVYVDLTIVPSIQSDVFGQRFDDQAQPVGPEFTVASSSSGSISQLAIGVADSGPFVVSWSYSGVRARLYDGQAQPLGAAFLVTGLGTRPCVSLADDGRFVVTWLQSVSVAGQRYDATGQPDGAQLTYALFSGTLSSPTVAVTGDGRALMAWTSDGQDGDDLGIFAQRYDAQGSLLGSLPW